MYSWKCESYRIIICIRILETNNKGIRADIEHWWLVPYRSVFLQETPYRWLTTWKRWFVDSEYHHAEPVPVPYGIITWCGARVVININQIQKFIYQQQIGLNVQLNRYRYRMRKLKWIDWDDNQTGAVGWLITFSLLWIPIRPHSRKKQINFVFEWIVSSTFGNNCFENKTAVLILISYQDFFLLDTLNFDSDPELDPGPWLSKRLNLDPDRQKHSRSHSLVLELRFILN